MKVVKLLKLLPYALVACGLTAWGGWIDDLKKKSTYDSSTGVYTLTGDFSVYTISGQDAKVDLNGHSFAFSVLSSNLELLNSSSTRAQVTITGNGLGSAGKTLVIGSGVDLLKLLSNYKVFVDGTMKLCEGSRCYFEGIACVDKHNDDARTYFQVVFNKTANVIVEPGAMLKQYVDPNEAQSQADWYTWYNKEGFADLCVQEGWVPESYELQGPDSDGYYLVGVKSMPEVVSESELRFSADVASGVRTGGVGNSELFVIPNDVGSENVTITYSKDGGETQPLGTYKRGGMAEWLPLASGDYVFSLGSDYQASFHIDKTPGIFITSAKQRWPWNGMVDIGYFVEGLDPEKEYTATFHVTCKGETKSFTLAGIVNGDATTAWDAAAATAWGKTLVKEPATVSADLRCLTVKVPEPWGTYMIVDLTKLGQAGCVTTETKESAEAACNAYNRDEYKTTKLVLRKVAKGQAYPVKPGATANLTDADVMTPQKDYYIGVFMVTKAQYDYVMGVSTTSTDKNPTPYLTYNEIRKNDIDTGNAMSPLNPVCNNSFMHRLVQGCLDADGNAVGRFDLPTEIQWEIACRAGSFAERGSYLDASFQEITLTQALIKNVVCGSALKAVGTYRPNAWGLYDMLGNLWQWCLDESIAYTDYTHVDVETPYFSGLSPKRMLRGYYYNTMAVSIRPGGQNAAQDAYANQYWNGGIRVCHVED